MRNTIAGLVLLLTGCSTGSSGPSETVSTAPPVNVEALCGCDWKSEYCILLSDPEATVAAAPPCYPTTCKTCACLKHAPGCNEYDGGKLIFIEPQ